ncbi:hypothetical protein PHOBOS_23 [Erwinia phage vB_EamM_Phobos]|uniref:hypothetical protein n=1 Tax=Erwinia phage vB_EamM_Phobos TaxID=1883377 RepID=UPI00081D0422|nr:hypothetical protein BIZ79_gp023 [Erwinia phage vB_EamM_Phobos]ANZ50213.1 hypothetical protein PHOBOS_23 [Erwinia phage vB_EamM_Phobos]
MFSSADIQQSIIKSHNTDPTSISIGSYVKNNQVRIRHRVEAMQRRVDSDHLLVHILATIGFQPEASYDDIYWACRRKFVSIGNAMRLVSPGSPGEIRVGEFLPGQHELIALSIQHIDPNVSWQELQPVKYLFHDYTNLNWELGVSNGGRGVSYIEINLVALVWQYFQAWKYYRGRTDDGGINLYTYLYRFVIYRSLPSYMNLALFNRHRFYALGQALEPDSKVSEYPVPNWDAIIEKHVKRVYEFLKAGTPLPGVVMNHIPIFFNGESSALKLLVDESVAQTNQQLWFYQLVNFNFMAHVVQFDNPAMRKFYPTLVRQLRNYSQLRFTDRLPPSVKLILDLNVFTPLNQVIGS